jgi:hypothetical protein
MRPNTKRLIAGVIGVGIGLAGVGLYSLWWHANHYVTENTEYNDPPDASGLTLVDDLLKDKNPVFDPDLVDSRPLGDWELNASAAVIRLDCPVVKPDQDPDLLVLRPSYDAARKAAKAQGRTFLPSANLLDGAAKAFDDGLYAALDLGCFSGRLGPVPSAPGFVEKVFSKIEKGSPARPWLAAGLSLAGRDMALSGDEVSKRDAFLAAFKSDPSIAKPISFYTWTPSLEQVWRFFRFFQREFMPNKSAVPGAMARVLARNLELLKEYRTLTSFYARLTNPAICLPLSALLEGSEDWEALARDRGASHATVAVFPPSTSRETELFERLFRNLLPAGANLMTELIRRIRSGEVDLRPGKEDGWFQHQVFALETLLLPSKGQGKEKLLLTARYKKRLLEAFKALITKRRETHARNLAVGCDKAAPPPENVRPRLRIEPCPTFYLRTARAYGFLETMLSSFLGLDTLSGFHAMAPGGKRKLDLRKELASFRLRFYGFYLLSCEDIGLAPMFSKDEGVNVPKARATAELWLKGMADDPDLAQDTRISVPIFRSVMRNRTRLWATLGVRLAPLEASYVRPPRVRVPKGEPKWKEVEAWQLGESRYVLAVDEFAAFELQGLTSLSRAELREICDRHKTKEKILQAMAKRR